VGHLVYTSLWAGTGSKCLLSAATGFAKRAQAVLSGLVGAHVLKAPSMGLLSGPPGWHRASPSLTSRMNRCWWIRWFAVGLEVRTFSTITQHP